jgi:hypothetical protein
MSMKPYPNEKRPVKVPPNPQTGKPVEHKDGEFVPANECSDPIEADVY